MFTCKKAFVIILVAVLCASYCPEFKINFVSAHTTDITPNADASYSQDPDSNYGTEQWLKIDDNYEYGYRSLLNFSLTTIPAGATIISATLWLYFYDWEGTPWVSETLHCKRVTSSWTETGVLWSTQPSVTDTDLAATEFSSLDDGSWITFDVLNIVQGWVNSSYTNYGFRVAYHSEHHYGPPPAIMAKFRSREYTDSYYRPQLIVEYSQNPDTPTLTLPGDGSTQSSNTRFEWSYNDPDGDVQGAYAYQLSRDVGFTDLVIYYSKVYSSNNYAYIDLPSAEDTYYWRVKVWDEHDFNSSWSTIFSVTVNTTISYNFAAAFYESGLHDGNSTVDVFYASGSSSSFLANSSMTQGFSDIPLYFRWNMTSGYRYYYPMAAEENITLFVPEGAYDTYTFTIQDFSGKLAAEDCYLESCRYINSTIFTVERKLIQDYINAVPLKLEVGGVYLIRIWLGDTLYSFGLFPAETDTEQIVTIQGIQFSDYTLLSYQNIHVEASRVSYVITVNYEDLLDETDLVQLNIIDQYGTVQYSDSASAPEIMFQWADANSTQNYIVQVIVTHGYYGSLTFTRILFYTPTVSSPFDVSFMGNWPIPSTSVFSLFIILCIAGLFSYLTVPVGILLTALISGTMIYLGWTDLSLTLVTDVVAFAIILGIVYGKRRS